MVVRHFLRHLLRRRHRRLQGTVPGRRATGMHVHPLDDSGSSITVSGGLDSKKQSVSIAKVDHCKSNTKETYKNIQTRMTGTSKTTRHVPLSIGTGSHTRSTTTITYLPKIHQHEFMRHP